MRRLIAVAAAILITSPVAAQEGKAWIDEGCLLALESKPDGQFTIFTTDGAYENRCRIASWPISNPQAIMSCADGSGFTMELMDTSVVLDDLALPNVEDSPIVLYPRGASRVTCD